MVCALRALVERGLAVVAAGFFEDAVLVLVLRFAVLGFAGVAEF
jgi:hypothetical protein